MSLLLDARKKIELALEQTGVHQAVEPQLSESLRLEDSSASALPSPTRSAGNPGAALPPAPRPPEGRASGGAPFTGGHGDPVAAGKNLFAAKSAPAREGRRLGIIPIALISGAMIAASGGYYVWREINPPAPMPRPSPKPVPAAPITNATPPSAPVVNATVPAPATVMPTQESLPAAPLTAAETAATLVRGAPADTRSHAAPEPPSTKSRGPASASGKPPYPETHGAPPKDVAANGKSASDLPAQAIRIERVLPQANTVDPALLAAWQAYRNGDLSTAGQRYSDILKLDAKNRDALLGMAAIAQQQSRDDAAVHYYRQALVLDPRDPVAHAGILSLLDPGSEAGAESRLKLLLAQQPQSSALHFTLGNLYAEQSRWSDAQQSYFSASNLEPGNAQFAFNLAVSLDHLGKGGLAAQHYRRALQQDTSDNAGFDRAQTQRRINELMAAP